MIAESALLLTVSAPAIGTVASIAGRSPARSGRAVTLSLGVGTLAAAALLVTTTSAADDLVRTAVLRSDRATALLALVTLATATVVSSFANRSLDRDGRTVRFFAAIGVLVTGTALVSLAAHPVALVSGWVVAGWALLGLVGFDAGAPGVTRARRRIATSLAVGDSALLAAVALAWIAIGGSPFDRGSVEALGSATLAGAPALHVIAVLLVIAALSRSAITPFHRWLVGTIVAPTPVSAVVHAGFVSGGGILLIRTSELFVASAPAVVLAFSAAVLTVLLASAVSVSRPDVKGSLAWSTVAQMAFMVVQCAVGAFSSAVFHIAGHGMYKAARFLGAGDTVLADVRAHRRPAGGPAMSVPVRLTVTATVSTVAVGVGVWLMPPLVNDAGRVLIGVFAWITAASALDGWLRRHPFSALTTTLVGAATTVAAVFAYLAGLRAVEGFLKPALDSPVTAVGVLPLVLTIGGVGAALLVVALVPGPDGAWLRAAAERVRIRWSEPVLWRSTPGAGGTPIPMAEVDDVARAEIRVDVATATDVVAPMWPLSSFVAVNPLGDLEPLGFDQATAVARRWRRARTHLPLDDFRADHARGLTGPDDLDHVVRERFATVCSRPPVRVGDQLVDPVSVILADLHHGPDSPTPPSPRTGLERRGDDAAAEVIDHLVAEWVTLHLARATSGDRLVERLRGAASTGDPRLAALVGPEGLAWLAALDDDPAAVIGAACEAIGLRPVDRIDEIRGHLSRLAGWAGLAKWRSAWALASDRRPAIAPADVAAVRMALEAAVLASVPGPAPDQATALNTTETDLLDQRVDAVARALGSTGVPADLAAIRSVLSDVPADARPTLWLRAQEHAFDHGLLDTIGRSRVEPSDGPLSAQAVFCIDVRSEGLRRRLEETPGVETLGFAGFFGLALDVRRLGWDHSEPRCPVLVAPSLPASEQAQPESLGAVSLALGNECGRAGARSAHDTAKSTPGAPFVLAEALGWFTGVAAGIRTLRPPRVRPPAPRPTRVTIDDSVLAEQRVFAAEAVLRTMGLVERLAPLVLLCGHASRTVNNPHASALDCGACGGAAGDDNALAVTALLNSPDVRHGLAARGIDIPDDTWFVAGVHETVSDHVTILDRSSVPETHLGAVAALEAALARAGTACAATRAVHLPGPDARVRDRGADWAQVRPEWGLAGAAAFVIGPRSVTRGLDLGGRVFLHGYDAEHDPTGRVLETIMTAPLVVAHWISAQYYFSTVDPEVFGAGDKLMHNAIGSIGVVTGDGGDLRVGLPLQSTHVDGRRQHQPLRLLAVIQAEVSSIEEIIGRHSVLQTLVSGSWLRIAARSHPDEPWSVRTPDGTWVTTPRLPADIPATEPSPTTAPAPAAADPAPEPILDLMEMA